MNNFKVTPIFLTVSGSRLYGNSTESSDWDYRGVCFAPSKTFMGVLDKFEQTSDINRISTKDIPKEHLDGMSTEDVEVYDFRKFVRLAWDSNPNIIELLFAPNILEKEYKYWNTIIENRNMFLSTKALHTFSGYANSQLKRIRNHKAWIDQNPVKPKREDYGLTERRKFSKTILKSMRNSTDEDLLEFFGGNTTALKEFKTEFQFFEDNCNFLKFTEHMKNRNPERLKLELKYNFDVKHASHLVRLFYEAKRLLETGELIFPLPEIDIIQSVRAGEWSYDDLINFSMSMDEKLKTIADKSFLPREPDRKALNQMIQDISFEICKEEKELS